MDIKSLFLVFMILYGLNRIFSFEVDYSGTFRTANIEYLSHVEYEVWPKQGQSAECMNYLTIEDTLDVEKSTR